MFAGSRYCFITSTGHYFFSFQFFPQETTYSRFTSMEENRTLRSNIVSKYLRRPLELRPKDKRGQRSVSHSLEVTKFDKRRGGLNTEGTYQINGKKTVLPQNTGERR